MGGQAWLGISNVPGSRTLPSCVVLSSWDTVDIILIKYKGRQRREDVSLKYLSCVEQKQKMNGCCNICMKMLRYIDTFIR